MQVSASAYDEMTVPWTSAAGGGPILRGRRRAAPGGTDGVTLHFVHGNGFCGGVYWPLLQKLTPRYGLFCHDFEGHGKSDAPSRFSGAAALADRIAAVLDEQGPHTRRMVGIGHSYGAALTLRVAAEHPRLFDALVLLDPILMPTPLFAATRLLAMLGRNPIARAARRRRERWTSRQDAWQSLHNRGIYRGWRDDAFDCFIDYATHDADGARVLSCPKWLEAEIFDHPVFPWQAALPKVRCPVLLIHGESSYPFVAVAAQKARRLQPALDVRVQTGGHCFMQEDPVATGSAIQQFLASHQL